MSDPALQLLCAALVLLAPIGIALVLPTGRTSRIAVAAPAGVVGAGALAITAALGGGIPDPSARALDAAMAGSIAAVVAMLAVPRLGRAGGAVFGAGYGILISPVVFPAVLGEYPTVIATLFGAVDYAGVLATHIAPAGALLVVAVLPARVEVRATDPIRWGRASLGAGMVAIGALGWFVGVERVVDELSARILGNGALGLALAVMAWLVMERIRWARSTPLSLVSGVMAGWAAIGIGAPFLAPVGLVAVALISGLAAGAARGDNRRNPPGASAGASLAVITAVLVGGVMTSLLADGFGLAATGTLVLTAAQIGAVLGVVIASAVLALPCWAVAAIARRLAVPVDARRRAHPTTTSSG
ncbi:hypothetical protein OVN18_11535 [Microcella daejeonensis]|uniref:Ammonium transporter n=1 Tax=Microcella daejeonensis TaxID=2994971 RepID=A0A9E8MKF3_9MICO|nr:hypothetical protein [Microcella daejeonensis]WAB81164.1 hypothetical protein OVN18_11535 [Microcella daejeonensis]WAB83331.1 hypothetical protein OVN20_09650 [Microcella daejeonensis]